MYRSMVEFSCLMRKISVRIFALNFCEFMGMFDADQMFDLFKTKKLRELVKCSESVTFHT